MIIEPSLANRPARPLTRDGGPESTAAGGRVRIGVDEAGARQHVDLRTRIAPR
jgi:hypothetical protein